MRAILPVQTEQWGLHYQYRLNTEDHTTSRLKNEDHTTSTDWKMRTILLVKTENWELHYQYRMKNEEYTTIQTEKWGLLYSKDWKRGLHYQYRLRLRHTYAESPWCTDSDYDTLMRSHRDVLCNSRMRRPNLFNRKNECLFVCYTVGDIRTWVDIKHTYINEFVFVILQQTWVDIKHT